MSAKEEEEVQKITIAVRRRRFTIFLWHIHRIRRLYICRRFTIFCTHTESRITSRRRFTVHTHTQNQDNEYKTLGGKDGKFDAIILGTGLSECMIGGLLAVSGKKVLQIDNRDYYGGESASLNLTQIFEKFKKTK